MKRRRAEEAATARRDETVFAILEQIQALDRRLSRVEEWIERSELDRVAQADQADLIDLRMHSARLSAELSRVTVELEARIDELAAHPPEPRAEVEPVIIEGSDLELPTPVATDQSSGWEPITD